MHSVLIKEQPSGSPASTAAFFAFFGMFLVGMTLYVEHRKLSARVDELQSAIKDIHAPEVGDAD